MDRGLLRLVVPGLILASVAGSAVAGESNPPAPQVAGTWVAPPSIQLAAADGNGAELKALRPNVGEAPDIFGTCGGFDPVNTGIVSIARTVRLTNECLAKPHAFPTGLTRRAIDVRARADNDKRGITIAVIALSPSFTDVAIKAKNRIDKSLKARATPGVLMGHPTKTEVVAPVNVDASVVARYKSFKKENELKILKVEGVSGVGLSTKPPRINIYLDGTAPQEKVEDEILKVVPDLKRFNVRYTVLGRLVPQRPK